jgi:hypothetical protein
MEAEKILAPGELSFDEDTKGWTGTTSWPDQHNILDVGTFGPGSLGGRTIIGSKC